MGEDGPTKENPDGTFNFPIALTAENSQFLEDEDYITYHGSLYQVTGVTITYEKGWEKKKRGYYNIFVTIHAVLCDKKTGAVKMHANSPERRSWPPFKIKQRITPKV